MLHESLWSRFHALPSWVQTLLLVLAIVVVGRLLVRIVMKVVETSLHRNRHVDVTLERFLVGVASATGWVVLAVIVLGVLGVDLAALLGGLAIGGFVLGFALKDTLGNLAAGIVLQFNRPIKVGEAVEISGHAGQVERIGMALTQLLGADGRIITIPNGQVLGSAIINHTRNDLRRADVLVGISYQDDIDTAVKAIMSALEDDPRVLREPEAGVRITQLGDNAVGLQVRPWVRTEDYWQAKADLHGVVKRALDAAGCSIPFPQRDVHVYTES